MSKTELLHEPGILLSQMQNWLPTDFNVIAKGRIKTKSSQLIKAIIDRPEYCFSSKYCYKIENIDHLINAVSQINYIKLKQKERVNLKTTISASIEELIFNSPEYAMSVQNYIVNVRNIAFFWETIDKTPSYLFRMNNKLYFIRVSNKLENGMNTIRKLSQRLKSLEEIKDSYSE